MQNENLLADKASNEKESYLKVAMSTERGKLDLANEMARAANEVLEHSLGRKLLEVKRMFPGARSDSDADVIGIKSNGSYAEFMKLVDDFEIISHVTAPIREFKTHRFGKIQGLFDIAVKEIVNQEINNLLSIFELSASSNNRVLKHSEFREGLSKAISFMREASQTPDKILMNKGDFEEFKIEVAHEGIPVFSCWNVPHGTFYVLPTAEELGTIDVIQDLEVWPADNVMKLELGFLFSEVVQMYAKADAVVIKSVSD